MSRSSLRKRDESFWKRLSALQLLVRHRAEGQTGPWTTRRVGMSLEFAEYREYYPGDDFRYVDWNLYGRLDRLFVKVFHREENIPVYVLIDTSQSMSVGEKLSYAGELAGALSYIGLKDMNRVGVFAFARALVQGVPARSGLSHLQKILSFLEGLQPNDRTSLSTALEEFSKLPVRRGLVVVLSDMLDPAGYEQGLFHLLIKRHEIALVQILAPEDLEPPIHEAARLVDSEGLGEFSVSAGAVARYRQRLLQYEHGLETFCRTHQIRHKVLSAARPLERALFEDLRGVLFV